MPAEADIDAIAGEAFALFGAGRQIAPFSERFPEFATSDAYGVMARLRSAHEARGETVAGRKIGFTNRGIWETFRIDTPIWGYMYDTTIHDLADVAHAFPLRGLVEPRIEPEIVFALGAAPAANMDDRELLGCVEWVALGIEVVQSIYPDWRFTAADAIAAHGMHASLLVGPRQRVDDDPQRWLAALPVFALELFMNDMLVAEGSGADVLGGPLSAVRHLAETLARDTVNPPLRAGEIITTGTLTQAPRTSPGETWKARPYGLGLDEIYVRTA